MRAIVEKWEGLPLPFVVVRVDDYDHRIRIEWLDMKGTNKEAQDLANEHNGQKSIDSLPRDEA